MDPVTVTLLCGVAFATAVLSAMVGLAGGTVLLAVMLLFFEPSAAVPLHGVIQLVSNGARTVVQGRHVAWRVVGWYSLLLLPLALAGARVALAIPPSPGHDADRRVRAGGHAAARVAANPSCSARAARRAASRCWAASAAFWAA